MTKSVASIIYQKLVSFGVRDAFLYSGGAIMPLVDQFHPTKNKAINYYISSNEFCLGSSAVGYAKSSGKMGVCITTSGPGLTNAVTPMLDAQADSTPMMVISGQVPVAAMGTAAFQEAPATKITKSITKFSHCVKNPKEISDVMDYAYWIANDKKKGVVHIDLPKCVLNTQVTDSDLSDNLNPFIFRKIRETYLPDRSNYDVRIKEAVDLINQSERPVLYVGKGCNHASEELRKFAKKGNIPVTTTLLALGTFDETDPLSLKMLGMHGQYAANIAMQKADCIVALGSRFDDRTTGNLKQFAPNAKNIIHVNIEPSEINKIVKSSISFTDDCGEILKRFNQHVEFRERKKWFSMITAWKQQHPFAYHRADKLKTQQVLECLNGLLPDKRNHMFTTGVGNQQMQCSQFITHTHPGQFITSGSLGVMGCGLPYAIGMKIANPDKQIILVDGDQSFNMSLTDLKTIMEYNLDIKIIIMNNSCQSMVKVWEQLFFENRITATEAKNPDYCRLAESFGIKSFYLDSEKNMKEILNRFLSYKGPVLLNAIVDHDYCLPLVKPGSALHDMLLLRNFDSKIKLDGEAPC